MENNNIKEQTTSPVDLNKKVLRRWTYVTSESNDKTRLVMVGYCKELDIWIMIGITQGQRQRSIAFSAQAMRAILRGITEISKKIAIESVQTNEQSGSTKNAS